VYSFANRERVIYCPDCDCFDKITAQKEEEAHKQRVKERLIRQYKMAQIPVLYEDWTFESVDNSENKTICEDYAKYFEHHILHGTGLQLVGDVGNGKTTLGICVIKELLAQGYNAIMFSFSEMIRKMTRANLENSGASHIVKDLLHFDFILFDDFGRETLDKIKSERH
jgi:DNA replication protein DnaC